MLIQFGHNDEFESKGDRYSTPQQYMANLKRFMLETRRASAHPLLLSSITRRHFDETGAIKLTHPYSRYCRQVAKETGLYFIDLDAISRAHFQRMGDVNSALRFLHVRPGQLPHFPNGVRDDTHLNQLGAREVAQLVIKRFQQDQHPLALKLRRPTEKQAQKRYD